MGGWAVSRTIHAPIDLVWAVLVDVERMPEWTSSMRTVRLATGSALSRGSRVHIRQRWLCPVTWVVDLLDPPRHFTWRSRSGPVEIVAGHLLDEGGPWTEATLSVRFSGPGAGVVGLLVGPVVRRHLDREMSGLKRRAEGLLDHPRPR